MKQAQETLTVPARGPGLHEVTAPICDWTAAQGIAAGLLTVFCRHTSASLVIQENADPDVVRDLETFFSRLAPEDPARYRHAAEGPDDMPAHVRTVLTQNSLTLPVHAGRLDVGTWQGVFLYEHRTAPHRRRVTLTVW